MIFFCVETHGRPLECKKGDFYLKFIDWGNIELFLNGSLNPNIKFEEALIFDLNSELNIEHLRSRDEPIKTILSKLKEYPNFLNGLINKCKFEMCCEDPTPGYFPINNSDKINDSDVKLKGRLKLFANSRFNNKVTVINFNLSPKSYITLFECLISLRLKTRYFKAGKIDNDSSLQYRHCDRFEDLIKFLETGDYFPLHEKITSPCWVLGVQEEKVREILINHNFRFFWIRRQGAFN